ncbi:Ras GTPase activating protein ira2, partial [Coemansia sp. RSA 1836]
GAISSCIQEPSIAIQRRAGLALRALFNPALLSEWVQSADIAFAMWTLSLQVIQGICRAIVHSMVTSTMAQHRQLLEIMFDMLVLSNCILELSSGVMGATMEMAEYPQFEVAFEVVIMLHLWADDADITQLTHECIRLKIQGQQLMLDAGIPVDPTLSNHRLYQDLDAGDVKQAGMYSRLAQMRAIFRTIRKNMRSTAGAQAAWQETYKLWRQMLQVLLMREETARVPEGSMPTERDAANSSAGIAANPSSAARSGASGSASSAGDKDDKRDQVSRRRNVFEKLTGQANKSGLRNASGSGATTTSASMGNSLASASMAQRIGGGVAGSPGSGSMVSVASSGDSGAMAGSARPSGAIAAGAQLPAIIRSANLTVSELRTQWRYCTGFLLAAGGACITDSPSNIDRMGGGDTAEMHSL